MDTYLNTPEERSRMVKELAARLGFDFCGIAQAEFLEDDARRLETWLNKGMHGKMSYLERNFEKRVDPRLLVDGAKSVITLMLNYYPEKESITDGIKISKYAYGEDYHEVIRAKLNELLASLAEKVGSINGRGFVDSAPVLERTWANKSGLGWVGKNGNLIHKQAGSFYFLATLIVDISMAYDDPFAKDYCGTCTKCLDACPTQAILSPQIVDGSKCISYLTIELKDELLPTAFKGKMDNWAFGCDVCQDVCPWNRFSSPHKEARFIPNNELIQFSKREWKELTKETFNEIFKKSAIKRTKYEGLLRNMQFLGE